MYTIVYLCIIMRICFQYRLQFQFWFCSCEPNYSHLLTMRQMTSDDAEQNKTVTSLWCWFLVRCSKRQLKIIKVYSGTLPVQPKFDMLVARHLFNFEASCCRMMQARAFCCLLFKRFLNRRWWFYLSGTWSWKWTCMDTQFVQGDSLDFNY